MTERAPDALALPLTPPGFLDAYTEDLWTTMVTSLRQFRARGAIPTWLGPSDRRVPQSQL
ncbi:MAG: hypothetical protein JWO67_6934 [Streptosporangiaceae bacterium]|nr:hypothetical protein [Streptosporangiaceae bacterium]